MASKKKKINNLVSVLSQSLLHIPETQWQCWKNQAVVGSLLHALENTGNTERVQLLLQYLLHNHTLETISNTEILQTLLQCLFNALENTGNTERVLSLLQCLLHTLEKIVNTERVQLLSQNSGPEKKTGNAERAEPLMQSLLQVLETHRQLYQRCITTPLEASFEPVLFTMIGGCYD